MDPTEYQPIDSLEDDLPCCASIIANLDELPCCGSVTAIRFHKEQHGRLLGAVWYDQGLVTECPTVPVPMGELYWLMEVPIVIDDLRPFHSLRTLAICSGGLEEIPAVVHTKGLLSIDVSGNKIKEIPGGEWLLDIIHFNASSNKLTSLPDLSICKKLQDLHVINNELLELPDLSHCHNLRYLYASHNKLLKLPDLVYCSELLELNVPQSTADDPRTTTGSAYIGSPL